MASKGDVGEGFDDDDFGQKGAAEVGSKDASGEDDLPPADLKVILLGDSAVGKSKLVERFLMGDCTYLLVSSQLMLARGVKMNCLDCCFWRPTPSPTAPHIPHPLY